MHSSTNVFQKRLEEQKFLRDFTFSYFLMEIPYKTKSTDSSFWNLVTRTKSYTSLQVFDVELSPTIQKKLTVESVNVQTCQLVTQVYQMDPLGIGKMIREFLANDLPKLRHRVTQRLALVKYLVDSLKYKAYSEVQRYILKQWKKNVIFFSINTIWATKMSAHKFKTLQQFTQEYKKQVILIANLTHFYFQEALAILDGNNVVTFGYLQQDTAHKILNSLRDWPDLYKSKLIPLIKRQNFIENYFMDMNYDPKILLISEQYLDLDSGKVQLVETIQKIKQLAYQPVLHNKIQLLKQVRATFIKQIEQNRAEIAACRHYNRSSPLQKDDIIGCIIYCIVSGQITEIQTSLQALSKLLGPKNELLSKRGVDSYRADLQSAVEYLCQQNQQNLLKNNKLPQDQNNKLDFSSKSTRLQLSLGK